VAAVGAVIAVLVSLTSVVDWVSRKIDPPAPAVMDAQVESVTLAREREPLEGYLRRTGQSLRGLTRQDRREPGLEFNVAVRLKGAVGKPFPLVWTLTDDKTGRPLSDDLYRQEAVVFTPRAAEDARTWPIWVPYPERPGRFRLDVSLTDEKHQPVDQLDSEPFSIRTIPPLD
jgi:hypothetical protein